MSIDYAYLSKTMANLSGVPVRVYQGTTEIHHHFPVSLPKDPMIVYRDEIFAITEHVGYYVTPLFHYYGILNTPDVKIIIGPTAQIMANHQKLQELAFQAGVPKEQVPEFVDGMNHILRLPINTLLQMLCTMNHFLNDGETLELTDLTIRDSEQLQLKQKVEKARTSQVYEEAPAFKTNNTIMLEEALMNIVRKGDTIALKRWIKAIPTVQPGIVAGDQLRQMKNLFIVTVTLVSRAAIRGGMREEDALSLSDAYAQRVELLNSHDSITNLQYNMVMEFTEQVEKLRRTKHVTKLSLDVANYVRHHISERISVEKISEELYLSRPYLSAKFKQESGMSLTDFILSEKTEEAKRLLRYSDKSLSAISAYLGFSSHGHFSKVFKKYAGTSPNEYRDRA